MPWRRRAKARGLATGRSVGTSGGQLDCGQRVLKHRSRDECLRRVNDAGFVDGESAERLTSTAKLSWSWMTSATFGFFDQFTLAAWVKPQTGGSGTIVFADDRRAGGRRLPVVLDGGKLQVNLVKRWLDDALRVETDRSRCRRTMAPRRRDLRRLARRRGVSSISTASPRRYTCFLDELNQTFADEGAAPDRRRRRRRSTISRAHRRVQVYDRRSPGRAITNPGDAGIASTQSIRWSSWTQARPKSCMNTTSEPRARPIASPRRA